MAVMTFTVTDAQAKKVEKWATAHERYHKRNKLPHKCLSWKFSRCSGIGEALVVECNCGKSVDVTDYESW